LPGQNAPMLPDELDSEQESPYLRRQNLVSVRRSRISRRLRWLLWAVGVLVPVGVAGYFLATFALTSPSFVLCSPEDIVVAGNRFVSREEVLGALGLPLTGNVRTGTNVFRISLDARRRLVETLPWVRTAAVTRILPHGLLVSITERTPVAFATLNGRVSLVDGDGMLLEKPESGVFDFPVISGLENLASVEERRGRLALYEEFMQQLGTEAARPGWMISEVDLSDAEDLKALLILGQQTVQVHFGHQDFLERFRSFLSLLPELRKSNTKLNSVDLRYHDQIVVTPQPPVPAAEPAAPGKGERKD
jgi:cell division septal protein FtsQ